LPKAAKTTAFDLQVDPAYGVLSVLSLLVFPQVARPAISQVFDIRFDAGDHLTFAVDAVARSEDGQSAALLKITCYTGAIPFERFTIDLSTRTHIVADVDRIRPHPVLDLAEAIPLPPFSLYPLPDQIADKICAMYDRYGETGKPSTRYRDLVDLVIVTTSNELDAAPTLQALAGEAARRGCILPSSIESPGPEWPRSYPRTARDVSLAPEQRTLEGALATVGRCLDPILAGTATGRWDPAVGAWNPSVEQP
jgi:hypothetical protein